MMYRQQKTLTFFSSVVKNVASPNLEIKKLVYIYLIHHAEQEEHEYEAALKRGITDEMAEAEYDLIHGAELRAAREEVRIPQSPRPVLGTVDAND